MCQMFFLLVICKYYFFCDQRERYNFINLRKIQLSATKIEKKIMIPFGRIQTCVFAKRKIDIAKMRFQKLQTQWVNICHAKDIENSWRDFSIFHVLYGRVCVNPILQCQIGGRFMRSPFEKYVVSKMYHVRGTRGGYRGCTIKQRL